MVQPLGDGVWWYDLTGVNAALVDDGGTLTLVDTGMPWHGDRLIAGLIDAGFERRDVERILLTHYDMDHVGGLSAFEQTDATIYVGAADANVVAGDRSPPLRNHKGALQRLTSPLVDAPDLPIEPLSDGETVGSFTAYHTPGHTPGHVSYVSESLSTALLGDLVREKRGQFHPSPWHLSYDSQEVRRSIQSLVEDAPSFEIAVPGHGTPFERGGSDRLADLAARL
ncbi:MBL fold metallo-hydrolase [Haloarcula sp. GH36]|uniref:MBL fold metallo-hydrolase n=1 Tax=Haloarcula montana TaxID=3111776 RepID=UPI002D78AF1D|nr:MBL fold metallo-hydrolase [Haloarcula sp. GH36]